MGCFDESCCMSNIPIHYNDDVVQIYVTGIDGETCQGNMYFDTVWTPMSLPIFGKYNDYGDVEPYDNDPGYRFLCGPLMDIFKSVTPKLFDTDAGLPSFLSSTHSGVQPLPDGINSLTKNEYEIQHSNGREYSQLNQSNGTRVVKVFIHREIWNNILSLAPVKYEKNISDFIKWRQLDKSLLERIKANDLTVYESDELKDATRLKELAEEPDVDVIRIASLFKAMYHINPIPEFFSSAHGLNRCKALNRVITRHIINEVDDFISNTPTTESTKRVDELLTGMIDLCSLYHGSAILNKAIAPVCHRASQYQEKREMQATIKFLNVAKKLQSNKLKAYMLDSDD